MSNPEFKRKLREACLRARAQIGADDAKKAAHDIVRVLLDAIPATAKTIAGYRPMKSEIDVNEAMEKLHIRGHRLCLPVVVRDNAPLVFRRWQPGDALEAGQYGVQVPLENQPMAVPDVVIVPLAGFDDKGHRLGYGAGFYDHTIARLREGKKHMMIIGAAFSSQQVQAVPHEPHDQKMDSVATEKGLVKAG